MVRGQVDQSHRRRGFFLARAAPLMTPRHLGKTDAVDHAFPLPPPCSSFQFYTSLRCKDGQINLVRRRAARLAPSPRCTDQDVRCSYRRRSGTVLIRKTGTVLPRKEHGRKYGFRFIPQPVYLGTSFSSELSRNSVQFRGRW